MNGVLINARPFVAATRFILCGLLSAACVHAAESKLTPDAIDSFVTAYRTANKTPGMAVIVTNGTKAVYISGYGHDSAGNPITADTPFPIASLSKSFTALAIMQLVDKGSIELDGAVRTYLPEFTMADERAKVITVRQLLNHTSGMSDSTFHEKSLSQPNSLQEAVARLRTARLAGDPGPRYRYHNPNYQVAARLVEVVSGEPFATYMQRHIFAPLGMDRTKTVTRLIQPAEVAQGHARFYGLPVALPEPFWFLDGSSGIVTTPRDMAKWLTMQNNGGAAADGTPIVSTKGLELMHSGTKGVEGKGLGWNIETSAGKTKLFHSGWMFTYTAMQILLPDSGYGIAVMSNTGIGLAEPDSDVVTTGLIALIEGQSPVVGSPAGLIGGIVFAVITLLTIGVGIHRLRRLRNRVDTRKDRPRWRTITTLSFNLIPAIVLLNLRNSLRYVFGRDFSWLELFYMATPFAVWVAIASILGLIVAATRVTRGKTR